MPSIWKMGIACCFIYQFAFWLTIYILIRSSESIQFDSVRNRKTVLEGVMHFVQAMAAFLGMKHANAMTWRFSGVEA